MLLDTCILIDVLRGKEAALGFVAGLPGAPALSAVTPSRRARALGGHGDGTRGGMQKRERTP